MTRGSGSRAVVPPSIRIAIALCLALAPGLALAATLEERMAACLGCHGPRGQSVLPETPSLGGQPAFFVVAQLFLFRRSARSNVAMTEVAKALTDADLRAFGDAVSKLPPPRPPDGPVDGERVARGRTLAQRRPCASCHNPDFSGREQMPRLAHQREDYLFKAMREYRSGTRVGYGGAMAEELIGLRDEELRDIAHFLANFARPEAGGAAAR